MDQDGVFGIYMCRSAPSYDGTEVNQQMFSGLTKYIRESVAGSDLQISNRAGDRDSIYAFQKSVCALSTCCRPPSVYGKRSVYVCIL